MSQFFQVCVSPSYLMHNLSFVFTSFQFQQTKSLHSVEMLLHVALLLLLLLLLLLKKSYELLWIACVFIILSLQGDDHQIMQYYKTIKVWLFLISALYPKAFFHFLFLIAFFEKLFRILVSIENASVSLVFFNPFHCPKPRKRLNPELSKLCDHSNESSL